MWHLANQNLHHCGVDKAKVVAVPLPECRQEEAKVNLELATVLGRDPCPVAWQAQESLSKQHRLHCWESKPQMQYLPMLHFGPLSHHHISQWPAACGIIYAEGTSATQSDMHLPCTFHAPWMPLWSTTANCADCYHSKTIRTGDAAPWWTQCWRFEGEHGFVAGLQERPCAIARCSDHEDNGMLSRPRRLYRSVCRRRTSPKQRQTVLIRCKQVLTTLLLDGTSLKFRIPCELLSLRSTSSAKPLDVPKLSCTRVKHVLISMTLLRVLLVSCKALACPCLERPCSDDVLAWNHEWFHQHTALHHADASSSAIHLRQS